MAAITIRNLDDGVKARLRLAAARNGVSMEEQARRLLTAGLTSSSDGDWRRPLGTAISNLFAEVDGDGLAIPSRQDLARAARFES